MFLVLCSQRSSRMNVSGTASCRKVICLYKSEVMVDGTGGL